MVGTLIGGNNGLQKIRAELLGRMQLKCRWEGARVQPTSLNNNNPCVGNLSAARGNEVRLKQLARWRLENPVWLFSNTAVANDSTRCRYTLERTHLRFSPTAGNWCAWEWSKNQIAPREI
jgi:hypothetical protein